MTPAEITAITGLMRVLVAADKWPVILLFFMIIIGPWVLTILLSFREQRRLETVVRMYEKNVTLVKGYEAISRDLKDIVIMNTQGFQGLYDAIKNNQYCPAVRLEKRAKGEQL